MKIVPLEMFGYEAAPAQVHQRHPRLEIVCMADVRPSAIDWLWQNWIALGRFMSSQGTVVAANQQYYATRPR